MIYLAGLLLRLAVLVGMLIVIGGFVVLVIIERGLIPLHMR